MDNPTDSNIPAGIGGLESNAENPFGNTSERDGIAGAIDPDAARNAIGSNDVGNDFTAAIADTETGTSTGKKRGRKPGGTNKQPGERKDASLNINGVEKILYSLHAFAAIMVPELELDESESKKLAKAIEGVTDQYKLTLDPKVSAYIDLATVCGIIYGPRAVALYTRKKTEQKPMPFNRSSASVHPIRQPPEATAPRPQPSQEPAGFNPGTIIDGQPLK